MELATAINLIRNQAIMDTSQTWADLGCGSGLFTQALASLIPDSSTIYAIDKENSFSRQPVMGKAHTHFIFRQQDIEQELDLPLLDGILMANSLHYIRDKEIFLQKLKAILKPAAILLLVEYDTDIPVPRWVPYPLGFNTAKKLFLNAGFSNIEPLNSAPSLFRSSDLYSALIRY